MFVTCKCLNIKIESKNFTLTQVDTTQLTESECENAFFMETIGMTVEIHRITKELPGVVDIQNVGPYLIHRCLNCSSYTHAVHRKYGASLILVNMNLITSKEDIIKLEGSPNYSTVFRIVIEHPSSYADDLSPLNKFTVSQLPTPTRMTLEILERTMEHAINMKSSVVEEKIRAFTTEQYQILDDFRERTYKDHLHLSRLLYEDKTYKPQLTSASSLEIPEDSITDTVHSEEDSASAVETPQSKKSLSRKSSKKSPVIHILPTPYTNGNSNGKSNGTIKKTNAELNHRQNFDHEGLFMLEGMDDVSEETNRPQPFDQESDSEGSDNDEGIRIPRNQRGGYPVLAKSLPVSVPAFRTVGRQIVPANNFEPASRDPIDPHNIRASIKALAKSVHGDTVFGDLPRPRFSTRI